MDCAIHLLKFVRHKLRNNDDYNYLLFYAIEANCVLNDLIITINNYSTLTNEYLKRTMKKHKSNNKK